MKQALTVSALTRYLKHKITTDPHLSDVHLEGEISNFKHHSRGHFYFTLKDEAAAINAVMFQSDTLHVTFKPQEGDHVVVEGYISVFEKAGTYQIYVKAMSPVGQGALFQHYLALKESLEKAGYFDPSLKKPLPPYPQGIAIITSKTGAAVKDMISTISRRYPLTEIVLFPTTVQGENAKDDIALNIKRADTLAKIDVIIVGRGGGSIEDLWAFNERVVADAIYQAKTPIISAVGHETDFTIADFVADLRAPTPTGAAEMAVPDQKDLKYRIHQMNTRIVQHANRMIHRQEEKLAYLLDHPTLRRPERFIEPYLLRSERLRERLKNASPATQIETTTTRFQYQKEKLNTTFLAYFKDLEYQLKSLKQSLLLSSPQARLEQGYALVYKEKHLIKSHKDLQNNDPLTIQFKDGRTSVVVTDKGESHE
jgi:exodeoxyribonuclease VII large subunit